MFGIGFQEILLILLIALIFFGPSKLPELAKSLGKGFAEFKKAADEVKRNFQEAVSEEELKEELKEISDIQRKVREELYQAVEEGEKTSPPAAGTDHSAEKEKDSPSGDPPA
ncbi:MAG: twin-arginine translocase subunit TatB [Deltaproteobacteria bacterium]|nr:MAG: twin-arginine translocase subunit TatB [Deltaproteobacteria bacterium]